MAPKRKNPPSTASRPGKRLASTVSTPTTVVDDEYRPEEVEEELISEEEQEKIAAKNKRLAKEIAEDEDRMRLISMKLARVPGKNVDLSNHDSAAHLFGNYDFSKLELRPDHESRPLWIEPRRRRVILESFSPRFKEAENFLVTIAEPQSRVSLIHEYQLTNHSLLAAVSVGMTVEDIIRDLDDFSKVPLARGVVGFIKHSTQSYGKARRVSRDNRHWIESSDPTALQTILNDPVISALRGSNVGGSAFQTVAAPKMGGLVIAGTKLAAGAKQALPDMNQSDVPVADIDKIQATLLEEDDDDEDQPDQVHSFEIPRDSVPSIAKRCQEIELPLTEEYDFRIDTNNANLDIDLKPAAQIRSYQEQALHKMFGNGRARSGIIVLPCGAGKTLVGITAACTIKKGVIVICTSGMSVIQWKNEFKKWSNIPEEAIATFTSSSKTIFSTNTGVLVTTYNMLAMADRVNQAKSTKAVLDFIQNREWGLMILDEVHVAPADMFKKVTYQIVSHTKLGLTATLLREDNKIEELNFLIGPKLFEANWQELSEQGHIAKVQCAEVWCPMPQEFYSEYLKAEGNTQTRNLIYNMNPRKFQACQFLVDYHKRRGDKTIIFCDNVWVLKQYADTMRIPCIYGSTGPDEREKVLANFQYNDDVSTLLLSKVGDTSLDLPEATCLIQISAHYGSRRQEAQRLGRILRAKRRNDEGFNAFFYSLVSKDTQEMVYSSKRQAFLVDQGYAFKIITHLQGLEDMPGLRFKEFNERQALLQSTLIRAASRADNRDRIEDDNWNESEHPGSRRRKPKVTRKAGRLEDYSGGNVGAYKEVGARSKNKDLKKMEKGVHNKIYKEAKKKQKMVVE